MSISYCKCLQILNFSFVIWISFATIIFFFIFCSTNAVKSWIKKVTLSLEEHFINFELVIFFTGILFFSKVLFTNKYKHTIKISNALLKKLIVYFFDLLISKVLAFRALFTFLQSNNTVLFIHSTKSDSRNLFR